MERLPFDSAAREKRARQSIPCGTGRPAPYSRSRLIKKARPQKGSRFFKAETGNRTRHLRITSAPLCQMSYLGGSGWNIAGIGAKIKGKEKAAQGRRT